MYGCCVPITKCTDELLIITMQRHSVSFSTFDFHVESLGFKVNCFGSSKGDSFSFRVKSDQALFSVVHRYNVHGSLRLIVINNLSSLVAYFNGVAFQLELIGHHTRPY